ncbi:MAG: hypothetical protein HC900_06760, partial [Methylacidiphilales bacterium]|nr:hypothetical protein [Candidatus Methylacidiphilales bacterium]
MSLVALLDRVEEDEIDELDDRRPAAGVEEVVARREAAHLGEDFVVVE